ncbi:MAG: DUF1553 domain-containing protein [Pirellulales bacterium]|nr:DUF1553 domain-containing protein [Pirellulales bacterium]
MSQQPVNIDKTASACWIFPLGSSPVVCISRIPGCRWLFCLATVLFLGKLDAAETPPQAPAAPTEAAKVEPTADQTEPTTTPAESTAAQLDFFEQHIRPLLVAKCYSCHSATAEELGGELLLDSRGGSRRGGGTGPAVVPGDLEKSLLITAVRYKDSDLQMPPDGKLSDPEIALLEKWISTGAADPRDADTKHAGKTLDLAAARQFWSLRPITPPPVPAVRQTDWPLTDIDRFVLARQEAQNLAPAADADKRAWLRRVTYDVTGLPPTLEEVAAFIADDSPSAFATVVDRLLASPRYGERWGRHWLDVVRYADTAGDNSDYPIPQMHRYRDWVISALNRDLPYNEFVRDQLAGDLRGGSTEAERQARIIATGYLANARRFGSTVPDYPWHLTIEDTIDNVSRAFLGTSLGCARCHDHKFDPLTTRDYYGIYGIFQSTRYPWPGIELEKQQRDFIPLVSPEKLPQALANQAAHEQQLKDLADEIGKLDESIKGAEGEEKSRQEQARKVAKERLQQLREAPPAFETAYAVTDAEKRADAAIQLKGNPAQTGDVVPRHFPEVLGGQKLPPDHPTSGRELLAEWIVAPENPLAARVIVNRVWQHHFGRGIVPTPNDFGKQGQPPTHPELLDHLASQFVADGWSLKALHRRILLSRVYRLSTQRSESSMAADPANIWLSGYPRRRLDAEAIRDTLLAVGGNLDLSPAGPHPFPAMATWGFTQHHPFKAVYDSQRRSVYLMTQRIQRHPFLAIFDGADPSASTPLRQTSTTPVQALFLLNDPLVHGQSRLTAQRVLARASDPAARVGYAYELLYCRIATEEEITAALRFFDHAKELLRQRGVAAEELELAVYSAYLRTLLSTNEFVYLD